MNEQQTSREERFVAFVLKRSQEDTGFAARLRRADNPDTEYQSWDTLAAFGVNLEQDAERLPFALVGAALCRIKPERDGTASLGMALRSCFEDRTGGCSFASPARLRFFGRGVPHCTPHAAPDCRQDKKAAQFCAPTEGVAAFWRFNQRTDQDSLGAGFLP